MRETEADRERELLAEMAGDLGELSRLLYDILDFSDNSSPRWVDAWLGDALPRAEDFDKDELVDLLGDLAKGLYLFRKNPQADLFDIAFPGPAVGES